jgi:hypothetical protein
MSISTSAAAAAAAAMSDGGKSRSLPRPPGLVDVARGEGGLARHVLAAITGAQVISVAEEFDFGVVM